MDREIKSLLFTVIQKMFSNIISAFWRSAHGLYFIQIMFIGSKTLNSSFYEACLALFHHFILW